MLDFLVLKEVEGIPLLMPKFVAYNWPNLNILDFPNFCGAGKGLSERIIPDKGYGITFMHCCYIHDITHSFFPNTYFYFCISNIILFYNMFMTIMNKKTKWNKLLTVFRIYRAASYLVGVQTEIGWKCFTTGKLNTNKDYKWFFDQHILETMDKVGLNKQNLNIMV